MPCRASGSELELESFDVQVVDPLRYPAWDNLVAAHGKATVFHGSHWLRTLVETYGLRTYGLIRPHKQAGPADVWVLMQVGGLWGRRRAVGLPFSDACAPLLGPIPLGSSGLATVREDADEASAVVRSYDSSLPEAGAHLESTSSPSRSRSSEGSDSKAGLEQVAARQPLLSAAIALGRQSGWATLELRDCHQWTRGLTSSVDYFVHELDLEPSEDAILSRCSDACRRAIRKSLRGPLRVTLGSEWSDTVAFYEIHCRSRRCKGLPPQPVEFFRNLQRNLLASGHGFVALALQADTPVAGAVFLRAGSEATFKFGASLDERLEHRPNNRIFWETIRHFKLLGCKRLNLGRTSLDNDGLRRFKLSLGAEERLIHYHRYDLRSHRIIATPDRTRGPHTILFRFLPVWASRRIGAYLYRLAA